MNNNSISQNSSSKIPGDPPIGNSDEISLIDLLFILWRGKYIIAVCTVLATIAGVIYALLATEIFSTSTLFITKTGTKSTGNLGQLASLAGLSLGGGSGAVDPSDYLDKVIEDKDFIAQLFERKWFFNGDSLPFEQILEIEPDTTISNWEYVFFMKKIQAIRNGRILSLKKDVKTGLITLTSVAPDPQLAFDLNRFTIEYLSSYIRNSIKSQAKEKRLFIEERISETKHVLEESENALANFRGRNLMTRSPQAILEEARLAREAAMNQEVYIQFQKQYELARIEELDDQTLIQVVKGAEIPVLRSKPKRTIIVVILFLAGLTTGIIIILFYQIALSLYTQRNLTRTNG